MSGQQVIPLCRGTERVLSPKDQFYSIDPKIYQKVMKMYDILSHTLATLINSCLE